MSSINNSEISNRRCPTRPANLFLIDQQIFQEVKKNAVPHRLAPRTSFSHTTRRSITRRGVIWLGQTCNLRCQFCYFIDKINDKNNPEHPFMGLDKAKEICSTLVNYYGNNAVDIQGGEPTLYKGIYNLIAHCRDIGLLPTLITNGLLLDDIKKCQKFKNAGLRDFLISIHGLDDVYDSIVGVKGAGKRQIKAVKNFQQIGVPFRINCVVSKSVINQLPYIAELAILTQARVVNFIAFNPFADQAKGGKRSCANVPQYSEIKTSLSTALDMLEKHDIEANVRYFPLCLLEEHQRKFIYNFQQLSYDIHEWDFASWNWTGLKPQRTKEGNISPPLPLSSSRWMLYLKKPAKYFANLPTVGPILYKTQQLLTSPKISSSTKLYRQIALNHSQIHCRYVYGKKCKKCKIKDICDGFHGDYADIFGTEDVQPVALDMKITNPLYYIFKQKKIVESEDVDWAL